MNDNITFSRLDLSETRREAKAAGVKVPPLTALRVSSCSANKYFVVESREVKGPVWEGTADNAYDAKAKAINHLMEKSGV